MHHFTRDGLLARSADRDPGKGVALLLSYRYLTWGQDVSNGHSIHQGAQLLMCRLW